MVISSLARSIILTIAYTDQFGFPLAETEVYHRLIAPTTEATAITGLSLAEVKGELQQLVRQQILAQRDNWYVLAGSEHFFALRDKREKMSQPKWQQADQCVRLLKRIPWLKGIFVTGSVAMNDAGIDDDVDFMLVVERNRLWLVRALVIVVTSMFGKRRSWSHGEANSWCFNVWVDSEHLAVDPTQHSIYIAYEVIQAKCVWDKDAVSRDFLYRNAWVKDFLPFGIPVSPMLRRSTRPAMPGINWLIDGVDWLAYQVQLLYMKPHRTRERVGRGFAFFHPRDTKSMIMAGWQQSLKRSYHDAKTQT